MISFIWDNTEENSVFESLIFVTFSNLHRVFLLHGTINPILLKHNMWKQTNMLIPLTSTRRLFSTTCIAFMRKKERRILILKLLMFNPLCPLPTVWTYLEVTRKIRKKLKFCLFVCLSGCPDGRILDISTTVWRIISSFRRNNQEVKATNWLTFGFSSPTPKPLFSIILYVKKNGLENSCWQFKYASIDIS